MEEKDEGNRARSWLADCTLDVARDMATSTACPIIAHPSRCMCEDGAKLKHKFVLIQVLAMAQQRGGVEHLVR
jgi:hypothetical protein